MAAWAQVDEGMDIIVQKTGATGDALEEMQDSARNIAKPFQQTLRQLVLLLERSTHDSISQDKNWKTYQQSLFGSPN